MIVSSVSISGDPEVLVELNSAVLGDGGGGQPEAVLELISVQVW
jgi:hypothetical protein